MSAAVSAAFGAATSQILGFTTARAIGFALNGIYFSRVRLTIYNAGLDAVACMRDATAPLPAKEKEIANQRQTLITATQTRESAMTAAAAA